MELPDFVKKFSEQFEDSEISNINADTDYKSLPTWDSLTAMSVQVMIQDDYQVKINPEELKTATTVIDLFKLVESKSPNN